MVTNSRGEAFWRHFQYHLRQQMEAASLNYWVKLSGRWFLVQMCNPLVSRDHRCNSHWVNGVSLTACHLHYGRIPEAADHGDSIPTD